MKIPLLCSDFDKKRMEKELLEWAFELLKHYKIVPEDTTLEIKEVDAY